MTAKDASPGPDPEAMGNYALMLAFLAIVALGLLTFSTRTSTQSADAQLADHVHKNVTARNAAATGLEMTVRKLVADTSRWTTDLTKYEFTGQTYGTATFTTDVQANYLAGPQLDACAVDTLDVVSTGLPSADASGELDHRIEATYVRTCSDESSGSSGLGYGTISDKQFFINGETLILSPDPDENADLHTNQNLYVNGSPEVDGFGTYVSSSGNLCDTCDYFLPNDDTNGSDGNVYQSSYIDIPTLSASDFYDDATYVHSGNFEVNGDLTINFTDYQGITGYGTADNPFVWYIEGDLMINSDTFLALGYVQIIVEGYLLINGGADILASSDPSAPPPPESTYDNRNEVEMAEWINTYYSEGTAGVYVFGTKDGQDDQPGVHFNGDNTLAGNIYSIGQVLINGDTTTIGTITTKDEMYYNGKNVLWYVGGHESIDLLGGGSGLVPNGVQLLSYAEW